LLILNLINSVGNNYITSVEILEKLIFSAGAIHAQINLIILKSNNLVAG
jgi:hypothetical protein